MKILSLMLFAALCAFSVKCEKPGRCKTNTTVITECNGSTNCEQDEDCPGADKCCTNNCGKMCTRALFTGCELLKKSSERQVRALDPEQAMSISLPKCREDGMFEEIRCNSSNICWCVHPEFGYEIPDTRTKKGQEIDCKTGRGKCLGPTCRMFCDHGFSLDDDGCQICKCFNPCQKVKCPGSQECEVKYVDCITGKCPVPTCRKSRTLDSLCPVGNPLLAEGGEKPLLCGVESYKPQCPGDMYKCNVQGKNDYGVCCPFKGKMGDCPKDVHPKIHKCSNDTCSSDIDCIGDKKCCSTADCGSMCVNAVNNTLCMQQREIAEHRSSVNFVPECSPDGQYLPKQCNKEKTMCWCVNDKGAMKDSAMKPADQVQCEPQQVLAAEPRLADEASGRRKKNPCKIGMPLNDKTGQEIFCGRGVGRQDCPATYKCEIHPTDSYAVCCATPRSIVKTKIGECPELIPEPRLCPRERNGTCVSDSHCPDELHCCPSQLCGSLCTDPDVDSLPNPNLLPTTCEFLRNLKRTTGSTPGGRSLAIHNPRCQKDGIWESVQCNTEECWCVNEFGVEIDKTRGKYSDQFDCREARDNDLCDRVLCRLACNYGFSKGPDGCPICKCRSACDDISCGDGRTCIQRDIECGTGYCIPVATCEPTKENVKQTCTRGSSPLIHENNAVITCDNKHFKCPKSYTCVGNTEMALGICCSESVGKDKEGQCPATGRSAVDICAEQCQGDADCSGPQKCCKNGCGAHVCMEPAGVSKKPGQCPYRPFNSGISCDFQCSSDFDCTGDQKCCSNGCGTSCMKPKLMTACQLANEIAEHRIKSIRRNRLRVSVPKCQPDGQYQSAQCDAIGINCWCVDNSGNEIPESRAGPGQQLDCDVPTPRHRFQCDLKCEHGYVIKSNGRSDCKCRDPCEGVICPSDKECRMTKVECVRSPCPPVAICLPKLSNPCELGMPLKEDGSDKYLVCGPNKNQCPSSHACNMSPFGEYAVCCPKPKKTCEQEVAIGVCKSALSRWYFDSNDNSCKKFTYGGCGGNLNNFKSEEHCKKTCPTMTSCQVTKRKSRRLRNFYAPKISFQPKCNDNSGDFKNIQCLDAFGLCWCVDKKGMQLPGTLVRGRPTCSSRGGRTLEETPICKDGESVNICKEIHCDGVVCKANPDAVCRINPCGSCRAEFYDELGEVVDCTQGLTDCEKKHQEVINSHRWRLQSGILSAEGDDSSSDESNFTIPSTLVERFKRLAPEEIVQVPAKMTISPPQCLPNGDYQPVQNQNGLSWCINKFGEPSHDTLSRGSLECNDEGAIVNQESQSKVCPNSDLPLRVCNEACLTAHCPAHPDAICTADPCNNCQVNFIDSSGNKLNCDSKCSQPMVEGKCGESLTRFYFDQATEKCQQFTYSGCQGNGNNFDTIDSCLTECVKPVPVCDQPVKIGICRMHDSRWFYNKQSQRCEEFIYGGCKGNDNNFLTKQACEARCPDNVMCPWTDIQEKKDFEPCSRENACKDRSCSYPNAVCTVNPCTCEPSFIDMNGQAVNCDDDGSNVPNYIFDGTRCTKIREEQFKTGSSFSVGCDKQGEFLPVQCNAVKDDKETCWCVDEAGNQLSNTSVFIRGEKKCEFVGVESVDILLTFKHDGEISDEQLSKIKQSISGILASLSAETLDGVSVMPDEKESVQTRFTLVGKNKVNAAYHLEKMLKETDLKLEVDGRIFKSDYSASKFQHQLASEPSSTLSSTPEKASGMAKNTVALIVIFTILGILAIFAVIAAVIIYKKRVRTYTPKRDSASLVSSSC